MEQWKDIKGYEGYYQVSNLGRVKGLKRKLWNGKGHHFKEEKLMKPYPTKINKRPNYNLYHVKLSKNYIQKGLAVHRLVAIAFIPNPENKPQVNHLDFDTSNNKVSNLEWCTQMENMKHSKANGRRLKKNKE